MSFFDEELAEYEKHGSITCSRCGAEARQPCRNKKTGGEVQEHGERLRHQAMLEGYVRRRQEDERHEALIHPDGRDCDVVTHSTEANPVPWVRRYDVHPAWRSHSHAHDQPARPYAWCFGVRASGSIHGEEDHLLLVYIHQGAERFHWSVGWAWTGKCWDEGFADTFSDARHDSEVATAECIDDYLTRAADPAARLWPTLDSYEDYARAAIDWLRWIPGEPMTERMRPPPKPLRPSGY